MKHILLPFFLCLPFVGICQGNAMSYIYRGVEEIPSDYNAENYKNEKKETVTILREYIEQKDKKRIEVELELLEVDDMILKNYIDTNIANKYLNIVRQTDGKAPVDEQTKRLLKRLGYQSELEDVKTFGDLDVVTDMVQDKIRDRFGAMAAAMKLKKNNNNINSDLSQAHKRVDELYGFLYDDGKFRLWITIIFSLIISSLLILFFVFITRRFDTQLAKDFLSSGNGLQFITLFSLIIAIILFGVMGILEGRELAAILSGISGYILGKGINLPKGETAQNKQEEKPATIPTPPDEIKQA